VPVASPLLIIRRKFGAGDRAAESYQQFGFIPMPSQPLKLFLPMESVATLFDE
jgi:hypothetical protein